MSLANEKCRSSDNETRHTYCKRYIPIISSIDERIITKIHRERIKQKQ